MGQRAADAADAEDRTVSAVLTRSERMGNNAAVQAAAPISRKIGHGLTRQPSKAVERAAAYLTGRKPRTASSVPKTLREAVMTRHHIDTALELADLTREGCELVDAANDIRFCLGLLIQHTHLQARSTDRSDIEGDAAYFTESLLRDVLRHVEKTADYVDRLARHASAPAGRS